VTVTHQQPERLVYDGEERWAFSTPLGPYLQSMPRPPELGGWNTSLRRRYVGSWIIDDDLLYLTDISATFLNLTKVDGATGWVGLSGDRRGGQGPVLPDAGFVKLPLPDGLKRFGLQWDLRWMTFDDNAVTLGVPAPLAGQWADSPDLVIRVREPRTKGASSGSGVKSATIRLGELE
jgi:hypothetical protein